MKTFYATFLPGQAGAGSYVEIRAEDHHAARFYMISTYRDQWSQQLVDDYKKLPRNLKRRGPIFQRVGSKDLQFTTGRRAA